MDLKEKINVAKSNLFIGASTMASALACPSLVKADGDDFIGKIEIGANGITGIEQSNMIDQGNVLVNKLRDILGIVQGLSIVLCVIFLVVAGAQLAMSSGNSKKREQAYEAIKNCGIGACVTGAAAMVIQIAYSFLL